MRDPYFKLRTDGQAVQSEFWVWRGGEADYRVGNQPGPNEWVFDQARLAPTWSDMQSVTVVPEPSLASLLALGLALLLRRVRA